MEKYDQVNVQTYWTAPSLRCVWKVEEKEGVETFCAFK